MGSVYAVKSQKASYRIIAIELFRKRYEAARNANEKKPRSRLAPGLLIRLYSAATAAAAIRQPSP
jgi:hypothetical protein